MAEWYGKGCNHQSNQFERDDESEPILTFCGHPNNPEDTEGNCREGICPLKIKRAKPPAVEILAEMSQKEKRRMFMNFMFNELEITKEDVRSWIRQAADEAAERMVAQEFGKFDVEKIIDRMIKKDCYYGSKELVAEVRAELVKQLTSRITIQLGTING